MIRYDLRCAEGHGFDGWFRSSSDFDAQGVNGLLECPACGSNEVVKALMAPAVRLRDGRTPEAEAEAPEAAAAPVPVPSQPSKELALLSEKDRQIREMLAEVKRHVTANSEDVGERFPEIARRMHAEEIERRSIRGRATAEEAKALVEDGIPIQPLPYFPDDVN